VQGALGDSDGTVALLGTGSFFVTRKAGVTHHVGGWGFQLGDDGGGAILGRNLLRKTVSAHDRIVDHSPLTRTVLKQFGGTPKSMLEFVQTATPMDYGKFAPAVINAHADGDAVASKIVADEVATLTTTLDRLDAKSTGRLCMLGGLGPIYQKFLGADYQAICKPPDSDALSGAIRLAQRELLRGGA
jgi:glucosamine kinase